MSSDEEKFLIALSRTRNVLFRDLDTFFRQNGVTSTQFAVLEVVFNKGKLCIKEIQELILGTNGNIPLVVNNLINEGLVKKTKSDADARYSLIELTERGASLMSVLYPKQKEYLKDILSQVEKENLINITKLLFQTFEIIDKKRKS